MAESPGRGGAWIVVILSAISLHASTAIAASAWRVVPEIRVSSGDESDVVVDPAVTRAVVPGGAFVEVTPFVTARRWRDQAVSSTSARSPRYNSS